MEYQVDGEYPGGFSAGTAGFQPARLAPDGWHSRGYLPHLDRPGLVQMITFRVADAFHAPVRTNLNGVALATAAGRRHAEALLDHGHGSCPLRDHRIAGLVESALLHFDAARYHLLAWVVMPNHVHVLVETVPAHPLSAVVHAWKSFTANAANKLLGRTGPFWWPEYFDRAMRGERHLDSAIRYIHANPVKAGLVTREEDWPFSSAAHFGS